MGKQKQKQKERKKTYGNNFFWTVNTLKKFASNPLQIRPQNLREALAKAPQAVRTNACRSALNRASVSNREDILHIFNEAGVLFALKPPGTDVFETASAVNENIKIFLKKPSVVTALDQASKALFSLAKAAELPHNVLNEQLRAAATAEAVYALLKAGAQPNYYGSYECTAVHEAAYSRRPDCLLALLKNGGSSAAQTAEGRTPLHAAAIGGDASCVLVLLNAGVDVKAADYCSMTALHFAAGSARSAGCVPLLLASGADVNGLDNFEMTPLHYAAANGTEETVKILLQAGAGPQKLNYWHQTPGNMVYSSCETSQRKESRASVYRLLNPGGDEADHMKGIVEEFIWDEDQPLDKYGWRKGNTVHILRQLARDSGTVRKGQVWKVLIQDKSLLTTHSMCKVLQASAEEGNYDLLRGLIKRGVNPNARESLFWTDEVFTPVVDPCWLTSDRADWPVIHLAAAGGHIETVEALEQAGASLERVWVSDHCDPFGPLESAAANGHLAVAKMLLVAGCVKDREQLSGALRLAVTPDSWQEDVENWKEELQIKLARTLLDAGADPNAQDVFGHTAIMGAACAGWTKCLSLLVRRGGNILTQAYNGRTALHIAARGGHVECVRFLIKAGADVSAEDCAGQTSFHYVAEGRTDGKWAYTPWSRPDATATMKLLLSAGADLNAVDSVGATALHLAAAAPGSQAVVEMLLLTDACVNAKDRDGRTPLHYAAEAGLGAAVEHLLKAGADVDAKDLNDRTPRDGAKWNTAQLLRPNASDAGEKEEVEDDDWSGGSWAGDSNEDECEEILSTEEEEDSEWDEDEYGNSTDETCSEESESYQRNEEVCNPSDHMSGGGQDVESEQDGEDAEEEEEEEEEEEGNTRYRLRSQNKNQNPGPKVLIERDDTWRNWRGWKPNKYNEDSITEWLRSLRPKETKEESLEDKQLIKFMPAQVKLDHKNTDQGLEQLERQDIKSKACEPQNDIPQQFGDGAVGSTHHIESEEEVKRESAGEKVEEKSDCIQENRITSSELCRDSEEKQQSGGEHENGVQYLKREEQQKQENIFIKTKGSCDSNVSVRSGEQERTHRGDSDKSKENNKRNKAEEYDDVIDGGLLCSYGRHVEGSSDSGGYWENGGSHKQNRDDRTDGKGEVSRPSVWSRLEKRPPRSSTGSGLPGGLIVTRILKEDGQAQRYIQQNSSGGHNMESVWDTMSKQAEDKWQINSSQSRPFRDRERWERSDRLDEVCQDENQGNWSVQCLVNEQDECYVNENEHGWDGQEESCEVNIQNERIVYIEDGCQDRRSRNEWTRSDELGHVWDRQECDKDRPDEWKEQPETGENDTFEVREWNHDREDEWNVLTREESPREYYKREGEQQRDDKQDEWGCGGEKGKPRQIYDDGYNRYMKDDEEERTIFPNTSKCISKEMEYKYHEPDRPDPDHMGRRSREQRFGIHDHDSNSACSEFSGRGKSWDRQSDRPSRESRHRNHESKDSEISRQGGSWDRYNQLDRINEKMDRRSKEQRFDIHDHDSGRGEFSSQGKSWDRQSDRPSRESRYRNHESKDSELGRQGGSWDRHDRLGRISEERGQENYEHEHYPGKEERYCQRKSNERDIGGSYSPHRSCEQEYGRPDSRYSGSSKQEHDRSYSRYGSSEQERSRCSRLGEEERGRSRSPLVRRNRLQEEPREWGRQETKENRSRLNEWERSRRPVGESRFQDHSRRHDSEECRLGTSGWRHGMRERSIEKEEGDYRKQGYRRTSALHERYSPHKRFCR